MRWERQRKHTEKRLKNLLVVGEQMQVNARNSSTALCRLFFFCIKNSRLCTSSRLDYCRACLRTHSLCDDKINVQISPEMQSEQRKRRCNRREQQKMCISNWYFPFRLATTQFAFIRAQLCWHTVNRRRRGAVVALHDIVPMVTHEKWNKLCLFIGVISQLQIKIWIWKRIVWRAEESERANDMKMKTCCDSAIWISSFQ